MPHLLVRQLGKKVLLSRLDSPQMCRVMSEHSCSRTRNMSHPKPQTEADASALPFLGRQCDPIPEPVVQETGSDICLPGSKNSTGKTSQEYRHTDLPPTTLPSCLAMLSDVPRDSWDTAHSIAPLRNLKYLSCMPTHLFACFCLAALLSETWIKNPTNLQAQRWPWHMGKYHKYILHTPGIY